jgi:hypothetical protein
MDPCNQPASKAYPKESENALRHRERALTGRVPRQDLRPYPSLRSQTPRDLPVQPLQAASLATQKYAVRRDKTDVARLVPGHRPANPALEQHLSLGAVPAGLLIQSHRGRSQQAKPDLPVDQHPVRQRQCCNTRHLLSPEPEVLAAQRVLLVYFLDRHLNLPAPIPRLIAAGLPRRGQSCRVHMVIPSRSSPVPSHR